MAPAYLFCFRCSWEESVIKYEKTGMQIHMDSYVKLFAGKDTDNDMKKKTPKQIAALVCVALLVAMYIITFVVACLDVTDTGRLFAACLAATIGLPILFWIFIHFGSRKE